MPPSAEEQDVVRLFHALHLFCGSDVEKLKDGTDPILRALDAVGVQRFNEDFVLLTEEEIQSLEDPGSGAGDPVPLTIIQKRRLIIVLAYFNHKCREEKTLINMRNVTKVEFDEYRVSTYNPNDKIIPWRVALKKDNSVDLVTWTKTVKPSQSDYTAFKNESGFQIWREDFESTLQSHGLEHVIDPTYDITNPDLDKQQQKWLYKVFRQTIKTSYGKTIVTSHLADKDCRVIWKELTEHYDKSMTAILSASRLSTYLTSTRLHTLNWRGPQKSAILHFKEQARLYNEIAEDPYTDGHLINMMNMYVCGTKNLAGVLTTHQSARAAAGNLVKLTFDEYVELLVNAAETYDKGIETNPRAGKNLRLANVHDLLGDYEDDDEPLDLQAHVHDIDTPIKKYWSTRWTLDSAMTGM